MVLQEAGLGIAFNLGIGEPYPWLGSLVAALGFHMGEIRMLSTKSSKEEPGVSQIRLYVSPASLRCEPDTGKTQQWDPLIYSSLFEYKPQHVHKLIHNSHDPSYFACLIKDGAANQQSICYVFKADDQTKDPETCHHMVTAAKAMLDPNKSCHADRYEVQHSTSLITSSVIWVNKLILRLPENFLE
ncbi:hypothetical protein WISP_84042 [Willisornis vidua]|uniref:TBCD1 protein n=1 Tax=Willisornis vidua TaxID=1566151 RepID=A0ABQ9D3S6_9PASS|nr:hypothetical protein WISP_84042 [Willisornis vidua]